MNVISIFGYIYWTKKRARSEYTEASSIAKTANFGNLDVASV